MVALERWRTALIDLEARFPFRDSCQNTRKLPKGEWGGKAWPRACRASPLCWCFLKSLNQQSEARNIPNRHLLQQTSMLNHLSLSCKLLMQASLNHIKNGVVGNVLQLIQENSQKPVTSSSELLLFATEKGLFKASHW